MEGHSESGHMLQNFPVLACAPSAGNASSLENLGSSSRSHGTSAASQNVPCMLSAPAELPVQSQVLRIQSILNPTTTTMMATMEMTTTTTTTTTTPATGGNLAPGYRGTIQKMMTQESGQGDQSHNHN